MENRIVKTAQFAMSILLGYIQKDDIVVDGTCGNGYDTLEVAKRLDAGGCVYSFDIQKEALERTRMLLKEHHIKEECTKLIHDSHENVDLYIKETIGGAIFNLGYLPGGDKSVVTRPKATLKAVEKTAGLLRKDGLIAIVTYRGHEGGMEEYEMLYQGLKDLDRGQFHVAFIEMINQRKTAPAIFFITKK